MAMSKELMAAVEEYDRATSRKVLGTKVKELRAAGTRVTEMREALDGDGIPCRMRLMAGDQVVWQHDRRSLEAPAAPPPAPPQVFVMGAPWPDDEDDGGSRHGGRSGF